MLLDAIREHTIEGFKSSFQSVSLWQMQSKTEEIIQVSMLQEKSQRRSMMRSLFIEAYINFIGKRSNYFSKTIEVLQSFICR